MSSTNEFDTREERGRELEGNSVTKVTRRAMRMRGIGRVMALAGCAACGKQSPSPTAAPGSAVAVPKPTVAANAASGSGSAETIGSAAPPAPLPTRDPAAAKAANARGMQLLNAKNYKEAMAEFRNAIAADDRFVLAHYNLASAASRAHDRGVTEAELIWVKSFAAWDDTAKRANAKIKDDPDLEWFLSLDPETASYAQGTVALFGLLGDHINEFEGNPRYTKPSEIEKVLEIEKLLAEAPGKHDDRCDPRPTNPKPLRSYASTETKNPNPPEQGRVHVIGAPNDKRSIYASLRDGLAIVEGSRIISRTDPIGCTQKGASQDTIVSFWETNLTPFAPPALASRVMVVVRYQLGDDKSRTNRVALYLFKDDDHLVRVFDSAITEDNGLGVTAHGELLLGTYDDNDVLKQARVFQWNEGVAAFEEWRS